jgi:hypothetical protein
MSRIETLRSETAVFTELQSTPLDSPATDLCLLTQQLAHHLAWFRHLPSLKSSLSLFSGQAPFAIPWSPYRISCQPLQGALRTCISNPGLLATFFCDPSLADLTFPSLFSHFVDPSLNARAVAFLHVLLESTDISGVLPFLSSYFFGAYRFHDHFWETFSRVYATSGDVQRSLITAASAAGSHLPMSLLANLCDDIALSFVGDFLAGSLAAFGACQFSPGLAREVSQALKVRGFQEELLRALEESTLRIRDAPEFSSGFPMRLPFVFRFSSLMDLVRLFENQSGMCSPHQYAEITRFLADAFLTPETIVVVSVGFPDPASVPGRLSGPVEFRRRLQQVQSTSDLLGQDADFVEFALRSELFDLEAIKAKISMFVERSLFLKAVRRLNRILESLTARMTRAVLPFYFQSLLGIPRSVKAPLATIELALQKLDDRKFDAIIFALPLFCAVLDGIPPGKSGHDFSFCLAVDNPRGYEIHQRFEEETEWLKYNLRGLYALKYGGQFFGFVQLSQVITSISGVLARSGIPVQKDDIFAAILPEDDAGMVVDMAVTLAGVIMAIGRVQSPELKQAFDDFTEILSWVMTCVSGRPDILKAF